MSKKPSWLRALTTAILLWWTADGQYVGNYAGGCGPRPPPCNPRPVCPSLPSVCPQIRPACPPRPPPCPIPQPCPPQYCPPPPICPPPPPPPPPCNPPIPECPPIQLPPPPQPCNCAPPPPSPCNCAPQAPPLPPPSLPPSGCESEPVPIIAPPVQTEAPESYASAPSEAVEEASLHETRSEPYASPPDVHYVPPSNSYVGTDSYSAVPRTFMPERGYVRPMAQNDCCCSCVSPCRFRRRRRKAMGARSRPVDPMCNSNALRKIIKKHASNDITISKRRIQRAAEDYLGTYANVICGIGSFAYIVHTKEFCQHTVDEITCYVFEPL